MSDTHFDTAQIERWTSNFEKLRIDKKSVFEGTPALVNFNFEGKATNVRRFDISDQALDQVADGRNPTFTWGEVGSDNRQARKLRFCKPVLLDAEEDIAKTLNDPENEIMRDVKNIYTNWKDIEIRKALTGPVLVGNPFSEPLTSRSAVDDGMVVVDATSTGITKNYLLEVRSNFIRNQQISGDLSDTGILLVYSQKEEKTIMNEETFTNKDYYSGADARDGASKKFLYGMRSVVVAGNETGKEFTVANPLLKENNPGTGAKTRECLAVAPRACYFYEGRPTFHIFTKEQMMRMYTDGSFSTSEDPGYFFGSYGIVFTWECAILRVRGQSVQTILAPL
jgi:hypothetical protein